MRPGLVVRPRRFGFAACESPSSRAKWARGGPIDHVKRRRHTPEQIVRKLRKAAELTAEGVEVPEVAKALEVRADLSPLACAVRSDSGRRCEAL
jgi:hypothetical protein